jgi:hypothetical protein
MLSLNHNTNPTVTLPPYVKETPYGLVLGNAWLEVTFSAEDGSIRSFLNKLTGVDFVSNKSAHSPLFTIHLIAQSGEERGFWSLGWASFTHQITGNATHAQLLMTFVSLNKSLPLTVSATVFVNSTASLSFWTIDVGNPTKYAVDRIVFPILGGIQYLGDSATDDYLVLPTTIGSTILAPYDTFVAKGSVGKNSLGTGLYPDLNTPLQIGLYGDQRGGLYFAAYDTEGNPKMFDMYADGQGNMELAISHFQPETYSVDLTLEYPVALGTFEGSWRSGAELYREWALSQWWTQQGQIHSRKDEPPWAKNGFIVLDIAGHWNNGRTTYTAEQIIAKVDEYQRVTNSPILLWWTGWEHYGRWVAPEVFPPYEGDAAFRNTVAELHSRGVRVMVSLSAGPWDMILGPPGQQEKSSSFEEYGRSCAKLNRDGSMVVNVEGARRWAFASPTCSAFQEFVVDNARHLAEMGVDAIQLDAMFQHSYDYRNVTGHPPGYGSWHAKALLALLEKIKAAVREVNPGILLANEHMPEIFLPYHELSISHSPITPLEFNADDAVVKYRERFRPTPLFEYIYHGFVLEFAREPIFAGNTERNPFLSSRESQISYEDYAAAYCLVNGINPSEGSSGIWSVRGRDIIQSIFWAYSGYARDFTVLGKMLSPPHISRQVNVSIPPWWETPSVISNAWEAPDSRVGIVMVNLANASQEVIIKLPATPDIRQPRVIVASKEQIREISGSDESVTVSIAAKQVLVLEIIEAMQLESIITDHADFRVTYELSRVVSQLKQKGFETTGVQGAIWSAWSTYPMNPHNSSVVVATTLVAALDRFRFSVSANQTILKVEVEQSVALLKSGEILKAAIVAEDGLQEIMRLKVTPSATGNEPVRSWEIPTAVVVACFLVPVVLVTLLVAVRRKRR